MSAALRGLVEAVDLFLANYDMGEGCDNDFEDLRSALEAAIAAWQGREGCTHECVERLTDHYAYLRDGSKLMVSDVTGKLRYESAAPPAAAPAPYRCHVDPTGAFGVVPISMDAAAPAVDERVELTREALHAALREYEHGKWHASIDQRDEWVDRFLAKWQARAASAGEDDK
jgi:hypothetical protein